MTHPHQKLPFQFGLASVLWITAGLAAASVDVARWSMGLGELLGATTVVAAVYLRVSKVEPENPVAVLCFVVIHAAITLWGASLFIRLMHP